MKKVRGFINEKRAPLLFVALFAVVGAVLIIATKAATPNYSLEAEGGTGANSVVVSGASGGSALLFKAASSSTDFHTCYPDAFCTPSNQVVTMNGANIRYVGENSNVTSLTQMQKIKNAGFNSVRLVMDWEVFQPTAGTSGFPSGPWGILNTAISNAKAAGIYVILDPIHFGGTGTTCGTTALCIPTWARVSSGGTYQGSARSVKTNAKDYIDKVATDYANEPTVVAIDLVNEPKPEPYGDDELIAMYNTLISWARAKDPDKILMIETNSGDKLYDINILKALSTTTNIIYSFHHYSGGSHNSSGGLISGCNTNAYTSSGWPCGNVTYEGGEGYPSLIANDLLLHYTANKDRITAAGFQLPIWVGEWGIIEGGANAVQWRKDMTIWFKSNKIGRAYWQFANSYLDPPSENMSMTVEGSSTPGAFKSWINDIL